MSRWRRLLAQDRPRVVAGVMSGTSLDGIDVAVVRFSGSGRGVSAELLATASQPFSPPLSDTLRAFAEDERVLVRDAALLGPRLSQAYAAAVRATGVDGIDLVGCHGQTVRHLPDPQDFLGDGVSGTLQLVNGPALSAALDLPVVTDFRSADVALGGQGAPLVPYFDHAILGSDSEDRIALNLGGIANITALKAGGALAEVVAFDTGPANMVMDALAERLLDKPFDDNGAAAAAGTVLEGPLQMALMHPFFARRPPKSAGRQTGEAGFGAAFTAQFLDACGPAGPQDILATAAELTVRTVVEAVQRFTALKPAVVIASGGGTRNAHLMARLAAQLPCRLTTTDEFGVDAHFKEAMAFALLAHEAALGVPTGMPSVTGASRSAVLGSISWS